MHNINSYIHSYVFNSSTEVKALLREYFERSHNLAHQDQELYVLFIQCFEVSLVVTNYIAIMHPSL